MDRNFHFYNLYNTTADRWSCHLQNRSKKYKSVDLSEGGEPHFGEVTGGVEPWLMARWEARVEFLLSVTELLFLSLTVEALQGKTCQNSLLSGGGGSV